MGCIIGSCKGCDVPVALCTTSETKPCAEHKQYKRWIETPLQVPLCMRCFQGLREWVLEGEAMR